MTDVLTRVIELADAVVARAMRRPVAPWMWGPGLLGHSLALLQERLGDQRYDPYLIGYCRHHADAVVHSSDTAAPALVAHALARQGNPEFIGQVDRAMDYLRAAPRIHGIPDHLGTSGYSHYYPASVWVDSIMMAGLLPALVGTERGDPTLVDDAAALPGRLANLLRDERTGLWSHSWWAPAWHSPRGRRFPSHLAWGRGNGWVAAALPMIAGAIGPDHPRWPELRSLAEQLAVALAPRQRADGSWPTLLTGRPHGYPEVSATALIAGGWLNSIRLGLLPSDYAERARDGLEFALSAITDSDAAPELTGVSGPTIPIPLAPRLGYLVIPRLTDAPWGVAAVVLAGLAAAPGAH